jgi:hypothetical protein
VKQSDFLQILTFFFFISISTYNYINIAKAYLAEGEAVSARRGLGEAGAEKAGAVVGGHMPDISKGDGRS